MVEQISRISKLFIDQFEEDPDAALLRRRRHVVSLRCGDDVARSYTLQLALLTAVRIASRCFPDAVEVGMSDATATAPLLLWPGRPQAIGDAIIEAGGRIGESGGARGATLLLGAVQGDGSALRLTFDGWVARVGPERSLARAPEREFFAAVGVLAAALAMSEVFLAFARISVTATRRVVGLSLWRPDLNHADPAALGVPTIIAPRDLWILGLGHLGNAFLWTLASLPYGSPPATTFFLNDFDEISPENFETSLLFTAADAPALKTRACSRWLEDRGFRTRLIERRFDEMFRRFAAEPGLALCGFDSNPARRALASAQFLRAVECGLGGRPSNFDTIALHTLPNPRAAIDLWPDVYQENPKEKEQEERRLEELAERNRGYRKLSDNECGRLDLAGKAIAVPFVGAAAASLVIGEVMRLLHDGPAMLSVKLSLGDLSRTSAHTVGAYSALDVSGLTYSDLRPLSQ